MLDKLRQQIRECTRHAQDCASSAQSASCAETRDHYLALEQHWLVLSRHYLYTLQEAASSHARESQRSAAPPLSPFSGNQP